MRPILIAAFAIASQAGAGTLSPFLSGPNQIVATVTDSSNNIFIAGDVLAFASGVAIPATPGAYRPSEPVCPQNADCYHGFVAKISNNGTLIFSTYLSDDNTSDLASCIAVDGAGNVYVASTRTPVPAGASVGIIQKLSPDGSTLLKSYTIVGGSPRAIALSPSGDVYIAGGTINAPSCACPFLTTPGALQSILSGGSDGFVVRLDSSLTLVYSTLLGGNNLDSAYAIAVDASGNAYVTGYTTTNSSFPSNGVGYIQPTTLQNAQEVFVVELNAAGSGLIFSALFNPASGIQGDSIGGGIAIDNTGVYVVGITSSVNIPGSQNAFFKTGTDFLAKLAPDGSSLIYQTPLPGGEANDTSVAPSAIAVDASGNVLISGATFLQVPTTPDAFAPCTSSANPYPYVMQISSNGSLPLYSSYFPGGLAIRGDGQIWYSDASGTLDSINIHDPLPTAVRCVADQLTGLSGPIAPGKLVKLLGLGIGPDTPATMKLDSTGKVAVGLNGVNVYFNGIAAPLLSASLNEIDAVVPFENLDPVEFPTSTVAILKNGVEIDGAPVPVAAVAPALYADSLGCLTAFNANGTVNSAAQPAALGSSILVFGEGAGQMSPAITGAIGNGQSRILASVGASLYLPGFPGMGFPVTAPAPILYAGDVPGYVEGVFELQIMLPASFGIGQQKLQVGIGGAGATYCIWLKNAN